MSKPLSIRFRILAVAEEQFRTQGYSQTTMDQLAELLGMSKKTLYEHFRSKELLAEAMFKDISTAIGSMQAEILKQDLNPIEKLHLIGKGMQECLLTIASVKLLADLRRNAPDLWQKIKEIRNEKIKMLWGNLLADGMSKGYFRKELNAEIFVAIHMASVERLLDSEFMLASGRSFTQSKADLLDIFLNGILTEKGRKTQKDQH